MTSAEKPTSARVEIAVAVVERDGKFLIGLRPEGVPLAGCWEFPGGKLRPGESPEQAAARECLEETGLRIRVDSKYSQVAQDYEHGRLCLHFFAGTIVEESRPLPARFRWVAADELAGYRFPPANAGLLTHLAQGPAQQVTRATARP